MTITTIVQLRFEFFSPLNNKVVGGLAIFLHYRPAVKPKNFCSQRSTLASNRGRPAENVASGRKVGLQTTTSCHNIFCTNNYRLGRTSIAQRQMVKHCIW